MKLLSQLLHQLRTRRPVAVLPSPTSESLPAESSAFDMAQSRGDSLRKQGDARGAVRAYKHALTLLPGDYRLWNTLGIALMECADNEAARRAFEQALALHPQLAEAYCNLGILALDDQAFDAAIAALQRSVKMDPELTEAWCNLGMALYGAGHIEEAERATAQALVRNPDHPLARLYSAFPHLLREEWRAGWALFEERLHPDLAVQPFAFPTWDGTPMRGRLLIYGEQGLGDQIMFASCIPDVLARTEHCSLIVDDRLQKLFQRSFPAAQVIGATTGLKKTQAEIVTCQIAIGSLPRHFRNRAEDFPQRPYLMADAQRVQDWRARLATMGPGLKIGISWRGGTLATRRALRSIDLAHWLPILQQQPVQFVSLQYTDCREELAMLREIHGITLHHWPEVMADYDETAALVGALDRVISVCTSVVHLAGALGIPTWVLAPASPEWRYLATGTRLPWYPSIRVFRQQEIGHWRQPVEAVAGELATQIDDGI